MTSELNIYTAHFQLSSGDGGVLNTADFNNLEKKDLRNCSSLNICFEPEEISISDVKITKMFIHYDGITDSPQDYFGFEYDHDLDKGFKGSPNPIVTFELNKEVDQEEFRKSIWMSSICIFPEKVRERKGEAAFQQDNSGYTSIIDLEQLDGYIKQLSGAAIEPPKEISFPDGLDGYYKIELKELIGLNKPSQKKPKKSAKQLLRAIKKISNDPYGYYKGKLGPSVPDFLKKEADKSLKSDREFILEAIKVTTGESFPFASKKLRSDREIVLAAVKNAGYYLEYADKKMQSDPEIVMVAVSQYGGALEYANEELKSDREIVLAAVRQRGEVLKFARQEMKSDRGIVMAAVSQDGEALGYANEELKSDREIVMAAVSQDGNALQFASQEMKSDREIVLAAASQTVNALGLADKELKSDREIVLAAVNKGGYAFRFACKEFKSDREIVMAAVSQDGEALEFACKEFKSDREIVMAAISTSGYALEFASKEFKSDREIVLTAVSRDGYALRSACKKFKSDREIVMAAVSQDGEALEHADLALQSDREIVMAAVRSSGQALQYASYELQYDMEIIFASFEAEPEALKRLHENGYIEINETIILGLRKKFGEKTAKKYLSVDQSDLRYRYGRERDNLMELRKMMKR